AGHADNREPLQTSSKCKLDFLSERILARPIPSCEGLVDHPNRSCLIGIGVGEISSRDQRNFHGAKIFPINHSNVRNRAARRFRCAPLNGKEGVVPPGIHGQSVVPGNRCPFHAGQRRHAARNLEKKIGTPLLDAVRVIGRIVGNRNPDLYRSQMAGIESGTYFQHPPETSKQKPRARKQNYREGYLRYDKNARNSSVASANTRPAAALPQILNLVRIRSLKRRRHPEKDAGEYRDEESEKKHPGADVNLVES